MSYFYDLYKNHLKLINDIILKSTSIFYTNKLSNFQRINNPKLLWREMRLLGIIDSWQSDITLLVSANEINDFFVDSVSHFSTSLSLQNPFQHLEHGSLNDAISFSFTPITADEFANLLSASTDAEGVDG